MQMGLPPDTPLIPDRGLTRRFKDVYAAVDRWQRDPRRELEDLPSFAAAPAASWKTSSSTAGRSSASTATGTTTRTSSKTCSWPASGWRWSTGST